MCCCQNYGEGLGTAASESTSVSNDNDSLSSDGNYMKIRFTAAPKIGRIIARVE